MKKNAEIAAELIRRAINETGSDFALSNARNYLVAALNEVTKTQKKRERRENNLRLEEEQRKKKLLKMEEARLKLKQLEDMLREEQAKWQNGSNQS
jgi:hypothetical protein